jgi:predicted RNase H-like nuclease
VGIDRFVGLDLAWRESQLGLAANETGVAVLDPDGRVVDAGWTRGLDETVERVAAAAGESALLFVNAPLVVDNPSGQRACETQVGQRHGRWKVSANTTNLRSPRLAGVALRRRLEKQDWRYSDGHNGPPADGRWCCECYPYTTLVGATQLGYDLERPRYKRKPRHMPTAQ